MAQCYVIYHPGSGEFMQLGKAVDGEYQRPTDAIVAFVTQRADSGSEFIIRGDGRDPPPGSWVEVEADTWPGSNSDCDD